MSPPLRKPTSQSRSKAKCVGGMRLTRAVDRGAQQIGFAHPSASQIEAMHDRMPVKHLVDFTEAASLTIDQPHAVDERRRSQQLRIVEHCDALEHHQLRGATSLPLLERSPPAGFPQEWQQRAKADNNVHYAQPPQVPRRLMAEHQQEHTSLPRCKAAGSSSAAPPRHTAPAPNTTKPQPLFAHFQPAPLPATDATVQRHLGGGFNINSSGRINSKVGTRNLAASSDDGGGGNGGGSGGGGGGGGNSTSSGSPSALRKAATRCDDSTVAESGRSSKNRRQEPSSRLTAAERASDAQSSADAERTYETERAFFDSIADVRATVLSKKFGPAPREPNAWQRAILSEAFLRRFARRQDLVRRLVDAIKLLTVTTERKVRPWPFPRQPEPPPLWPQLVSSPCPPEQPALLPLLTLLTTGALLTASCSPRALDHLHATGPFARCSDEAADGRRSL